MHTQLSEEYRLDVFTRVSPVIPSNVNIDGQLAIAIWYNNGCVGYASVSKGLDEYYGGEFFPDLCDKVRGEWVIVQIQKGNSDLPKGNFRNLLVRFLVERAQAAGISRIYFMSSDRNYWTIPEVQEQMLEQLKPLPNEATIRHNYDWTAKRNKFRYDPKTNLFVKDLVPQ